MKHELDITNNMIEVTTNIKKIKSVKKVRKENVNEKDFIIPSYQEYNLFVKKNYSIIMLKDICRHYKLKLAGNKSDIHDRIYKYLFTSNYAIIIQKYIRKKIVKIYCDLIGPALINRSLCTNETDFFTFENTKDISYNQFFSYIGVDNTIWGFNILSFYNLFIKSEGDVLHPYTREKISVLHFNNIKRIIKLSKILNITTNIILNNNIDNISLKKKIELKCLELFQRMDELGNYTNIEWFMSLKREELIKFVHDLFDIWQYRAQLEYSVKKQICYPYGNPFRYTNINRLAFLSFYSLQKTILSIIEQFIKKGVDREACNLGTSYVLCGLTLVNNNAALAMPWLYQSVSAIEDLP